MILRGEAKDWDNPQAGLSIHGANGRSPAEEALFFPLLAEEQSNT